MDDSNPINEISPVKINRPIARVRRLRRSELPIDTIQLARYLIGKTLVHEIAAGRLSGRIVETEAYPIGDAAAHSFRGQTARNKSIFLRRGHAYVYFIYGSCWCMNVSAETAGVGGAILLRALEPLEGIDFMEKHRGVSRVLDLTRGPGRLAGAMLIDRSQDGLDLCAAGSPLWLGSAAVPVGPIGVTTRIGLSREAHRLLRFYEKGNPFVSGPRGVLNMDKVVRQKLENGSMRRSRTPKATQGGARDLSR